MNLKIRLFLNSIISFIMLLFVCNSFAGIPEPGLTMYGVVINNDGGNSVRLTSSSMSLRWTITPSGGSSVLSQVNLTNIEDQFSYALQPVFETVVTGFPLSPNGLELTMGTTQYTRSTVSLRFDGVDYPATLVPPAGSTFNFSQLLRGELERVDLEVNVTFPDTDGDGLPDYWELEWFGGNSANPGDDPDGDTFTNWEEYLAGTDPTTTTKMAMAPLAPPESLVAIPYNTVIDLYWQKNDSAKGYYIYRSTSSGGPYTKVNTLYFEGDHFRDINLINLQAYYYVIKSVNDLNLEGLPSTIAYTIPAVDYGVTPVTDMITLVDGDNIRFEWTDITTEEGVNVYRVYRVYPPLFETATGDLMFEIGYPPYEHTDGYIGSGDYYYSIITVDNTMVEATE